MYADFKILQIHPDPKYAADFKILQIHPDPKYAADFYLMLLTLQVFSPPAAADLFCWLRVVQPTAAQLATNTKLPRTAVGSEEPGSEETCIVTAVISNEQQ